MLYYLWILKFVVYNTVLSRWISTRRLIIASCIIATDFTADAKSTKYSRCISARPFHWSLRNNVATLVNAKLDSSTANDGLTKSKSISRFCSTNANGCKNSPSLKDAFNYECPWRSWNLKYSQDGSTNWIWSTKTLRCELSYLKDKRFTTRIKAAIVQQS